MHRWAVKVNDVSHNYNFQRVFNYLMHIKALEAVVLFKMPFLCSLGIQLADSINNLNN